MICKVHARGLHLEVRPISNVHTGAATSLTTHPITALWRAGISLSFNTDSRLMSCITQSGEAADLLRETSLTIGDLAKMGLQAAEHSFLPLGVREGARVVIEDWVRLQGVTV
jgi:adenosine deaminase